LDIEFLSPFLNEGFTTKYFRQEGKTPLHNDLLHMQVTGETMRWKVAFKTLTESSSCPRELVGFKYLITFSISFFDA